MIDAQGQNCGNNGFFDLEARLRGYADRMAHRVGQTAQSQDPERGMSDIRDRISTEIELVFKPHVMGQCISDWSMKQLIEASRLATERIFLILFNPKEEAETLKRIESIEIYIANGGKVDLDDIEWLLKRARTKDKG